VAFCVGFAIGMLVGLDESSQAWVMQSPLSTVVYLIVGPEASFS
jgi:hypothetical protein